MFAAFCWIILIIAVLGYYIFPAYQVYINYIPKILYVVIITKVISLAFKKQKPTQTVYRTNRGIKSNRKHRSVLPVPLFS